MFTHVPCFQQKDSAFQTNRGSQENPTVDKMKKNKTKKTKQKKNKNKQTNKKKKKKKKKKNAKRDGISEQKEAKNSLRLQAVWLESSGFAYMLIG